MNITVKIIITDTSLQIGDVAGTDWFPLTWERLTQLHTAAQRSSQDTTTAFCQEGKWLVGWIFHVDHCQPMVTQRHIFYFSMVKWSLKVCRCLPPRAKAKARAPGQLPCSCYAWERQVFQRIRQRLSLTWLSSWVLCSPMSLAAQKCASSPQLVGGCKSSTHFHHPSLQWKRSPTAQAWDSQPDVILFPQLSSQAFVYQSTSMPWGLVQSNNCTKEKANAESHQAQVSSTSHLLDTLGTKQQTAGR